MDNQSLKSKYSSKAASTNKNTRDITSANRYLMDNSQTANIFHTSKKPINEPNSFFTSQINSYNYKTNLHTSVNKPTYDYNTNVKDSSRKFQSYVNTSKTNLSPKVSMSRYENQYKGKDLQLKELIRSDKSNLEDKRPNISRPNKYIDSTNINDRRYGHEIPKQPRLSLDQAKQNASNFVSSTKLSSANLQNNYIKDTQIVHMETGFSRSVSKNPENKRNTSYDSSKSIKLKSKNVNWFNVVNPTDLGRKTVGWSDLKSQNVDFYIKNDIFDTNTSKTDIIKDTKIEPRLSVQQKNNKYPNTFSSNINAKSQRSYTNNTLQLSNRDVEQKERRNAVNYATLKSQFNTNTNFYNTRDSNFIKTPMQRNNIGSSVKIYPPKNLTESELTLGNLKSYFNNVTKSPLKASEYNTKREIDMANHLSLRTNNLLNKNDILYIKKYKNYNMNIKNDTLAIQKSTENLT